MNLTPEERDVGKSNYYEALGHTRRDFLKGSSGGGCRRGSRFRRDVFRLRPDA